MVLLTCVPRRPFKFFIITYSSFIFIQTYLCPGHGLVKTVLSAHVHHNFFPTGAVMCLCFLVSFAFILVSSSSHSASLSLSPPFDELDDDGMRLIHGWNFGGGAKVHRRFIRLTSKTSQSPGWLWSQHNLNTTEVTIISRIRSCVALSLGQVFQTHPHPSSKAILTPSEPPNRQPFCDAPQTTPVSSLNPIRASKNDKKITIIGMSQSSKPQKILWQVLHLFLDQKNGWQILTGV